MSSGHDNDHETACNEDIMVTNRSIKHGLKHAASESQLRSRGEGERKGEGEGG